VGTDRTISRTAEGAVALTMPDVDYTIEGALPLRHAASPHIEFALRATNRSPELIHTIILRCQVQLEVQKRTYKPEEQERLSDLFGEPERWSETVRSMLWTNTHVVLPRFSDSATVQVAVPCTFDFNIAATKYFAGVSNGDVPVTFYFSGTVFYDADSGGVNATQIPWEKEAVYRMPVRVWQDMMDFYYPNTNWLCLRRDVFERLYAFKVRHGLPTFEHALEKVVP